MLMTIYSATYSFNKINNSLYTIKKLKKSFIVTTLGVSVLAFFYYATQSYHLANDGPETDNFVEKQYVSIDSAVMPQRIIPPRFAPFEKTDKPVNLSLELNNSFANTLLSYGIPQEQISNIQEAAAPFVALRKLHTGHKIEVSLAKNTGVNVRDIDDSMHVVRKISLYASPAVRLHITGDGVHYRAERFYDKVYEKSYLAAGKITSSISVDARRAGVSADMIQQFIKLFSLNVDFRQLQKNDSFEFGFDKFTDKDNSIIGYSHLNYASLTVNGKKNEIFYIKNSSGKGIWINENGMNNKPLLMKTPIDGARLSSNFGFRRHPILGYTRQHTGIDFAAPTGTPIYASGDGVISKKYRSGSYGNYVKIRHNGTYDTAYAHMSRFAKYAEGQRVTQGDIIGYVGTTGRSTGPHLHYEVHKNGVPINPLSDKVPTVSTVTQAMKQDMTNAKKKLVQLRSGTQISTVYDSINSIKHKLL